MSALKKVQFSKENEPNKMSKPEVVPALQPVDRKNREAIKSAMKANIEASAQKKPQPELSQSLNQ